MLLTTRDAQREKRNSMFLAAAAIADRASMVDRISIADRLSMVGMDNRGFQTETGFNLRPMRSISSANLSNIDKHGESPAADQEQTNEETKKKKYRWRMTHFFYLHMILFIINALIGGVIVFLIENHSASRNKQIEVSFIDAWFLSSTCVYSCGLTTIDFAKLSIASQSVLLFFTFISGITISTLPALIIKAYSHKSVQGLRVDNDQDMPDDDNDDELPTVQVRNYRNLPDDIRLKLKSLPNAVQLRYRAHIICIILILATCFAIYLIMFITIGSWLTTQYKPEQLLQGNTSINPWYTSLIVTLTGFNQNGLTPFSSGMSRFVDDVFLNLAVMIVIISGTSLFPFILRNVIILVRWIAPWRYKVVFDYILINNHRLSTLLFPALQTRIYLFVTVILYIMGVGISLIVDLKRDPFLQYSTGTRVLIFFFHTTSARFAGFQTVDMNSFAAATLIVYLVLMATKPQMLCAIDESPFELSWLALQAQNEAVARTTSVDGTHQPSIISTSDREDSMSLASGGVGMPIKQMHKFLRRQSLVTKELARQEFANVHTANDDETQKTTRQLRVLRIRLFLVYFARALIQHTISFIILTRTWLFIFIFLICAIEYRRMAPVDPNITIFKIIFEIISAFGAVGLSLGYPNIDSSFCSVLSSSSKVIIMMTMLMGRHRGLLASMTDQEAIEQSASDLLARCRNDLIRKYEKSTSKNATNNAYELDERVQHF